MRNVMKELEQLRAKHGVKAKRRSRKPLAAANFPDLRTDGHCAQLSDCIPGGGGYKRDVRTDHKWRRGAQESAETIAAIEQKAARIRPKYSKGAYDYATDGDNSGPLTIHKKGG